MKLVDITGTRDEFMSLKQTVRNKVMNLRRVIHL